MARKSARSTGGAAASQGISKSKAIRDYMAAHPSAGPSAVADALSKEGIKVSAAFVSTVKSMAKKRKPGGRVGRPRKAKSAAAGAQFSVSELLSAKKLADELGSLEQAKAALDALAKLS